MAKFLSADLDLGLTFAIAALTAGRRQPERRERNRAYAQTALDAVVKHYHRANLDPYESATIDRKIDLLRFALDELQRNA